MRSESMSAGRDVVVRLLAVLTVGILLAWPLMASAGTIWFEYVGEGTDPGTVLVIVKLVPQDFDPCTACVDAFWSRIHVSPAPLSGSADYIYPDETGAVVRGNGFDRYIVLDQNTEYMVTDALTNRTYWEEIALQGGYLDCNTSVVACAQEDIAYSDLQIRPISVPASTTTTSMLKARFDN